GSRPPFQLRIDTADLTWLAQPNMLSTVHKRRPRSLSVASQAARHPPPGPLLAAVGLVITSRVAYHIAGVRFDASSLPWFWQYIDPALLKANFTQSLWYLHSQPPGFNFFLGAVIALFPGHEPVVFAISYLLAGLILTAALYLLFDELELPAALSAALSAIYVASPACVLYENWLFYTYPTTVLLLLGALFWQRFARRGRFLDALLLFVCAGLLALTWSLFHLAWLLGLALALLLFRRRDWRKVLAAAAVPVLIVVLWYGKNLAQVGEFTGSTWFGMNLSKMTNSMLAIPERRSLYDSGRISAVSEVPPFSEPDKYSGLVSKPEPTGIPVLDQEMKPSDVPNFNNSLYVSVSRQYGRDALRIIATRPAAYLRGLAESYLLYFLPTSAYAFLGSNAAHIKGLARFASFLSGRFTNRFAPGLRLTRPGRYYLQGFLNTAWFLIVAYLLVLTLGAVLFIRPLSSSLRPSSVFFLWFNVVWMTLVANALEVGENNRFRFVTDPLVFAFLAALASGWVLRRRRRLQSAKRQ
ncbi:hypothetical protein JXD38_01135, partial [candidate division WOR-3 bacterium]|nr:hypothetical protein [candidate division WOR-3 bacterium]